MIKRLYRQARYSRGNKNTYTVDPLDDCAWIWHPDFKDEFSPAQPRFLRFRKKFTAPADAEDWEFDVSADERFALFLDGALVARGPHRGSVENWQCQAYRVSALPPGEHILDAVVWQLGEDAPLAQLSWRGGFALRASGIFHEQLTTGAAVWQTGVLRGTVPNGLANGVFGTGGQFIVQGCGIYQEEPQIWRDAVIVREKAGLPPGVTPYYGLRKPGWMAFNSQLPEQTEIPLAPGKIVAAATGAPFMAAPETEYIFRPADLQRPEIAEFNRLLRGEKITVPAHTRLQLAWNLQNYYCAYPELTVSAGRGGKIAWTWTEAARSGQTRLKNDRNAIDGQFLDGYGDIFIFDGREHAEFSTPWFRCGKWCRLDIVTAGEPLIIEKIGMIESRYPLEEESAFSSPEAPDMRDIRAICTRAMQMCCHEMLFDCPYYEQQMYPGDTRVQLLILTALTADDRMIRRAVEMFDLARRDDGLIPMNWPTRGLQESLSYTLCYLCMYGDYVMNHDNREWLKARLPGLRATMAGVEYYENAEGMLENSPGWSFVDWVKEWSNGVPPGAGYSSDTVNSEINLFWLLAMRSAIITEKALGNAHCAAYWEEKATRLAGKILQRFWCAERELLADTPQKKHFSEHAQCLALLADIFPAEQAARVAEHLIDDTDLARTSVYFSFYLFAAYFKIRRADLFLKRLDLWRGYCARGVNTLLEEPDEAAASGESRSDCHAWGAHPLWFMQTGLAGIQSAAPFFNEVLVAPEPGNLQKIHARHPHPTGQSVRVDLDFSAPRVSGTIETPVPGIFRYRGYSQPLRPGINHLGKA